MCYQTIINPQTVYQAVTVHCKAPDEYQGFSKVTSWRNESLFATESTAKVMATAYQLNNWPKPS